MPRGTEAPNVKHSCCSDGSGSATVGLKYDEIVIALSPLIWKKCNNLESSVLVENFGSLGSDWDGTFDQNFYTQGQFSQLGFNEGIKVDVIGDYIYRDPAGSDMILNDFTFAVLMYFPTNITSAASMTYYKPGIGGGDINLYINDISGFIRFQLDNNVLTSNKTPNEGFNFGEFLWSFVRYNSITGQIEMNWTVNKVLINPTYSLNTELVTGSVTMAGYYHQLETVGAILDEVLVFPSFLTTEDMQNIIDTTLY